MLSGCWLLSDLDGTLVSTPHKAHGKYPSITQSPCFNPIRRWLLNGGNICIITTADLRTLSQVYFPLQPYLAKRRFGDLEHTSQKGGNDSQTTLKPSNSHASDTSSSSSDACRTGRDFLSHLSQSSEGSESSSQGVLLLSLYSGAALYLCTSNSVELMTDYVHSTHRAIREPSDLLNPCRASQIPLQCAREIGGGDDDVCSGIMNYVQGTCISRNVSEKLLAHITKLYESYISDLLGGEPTVVAASLQLSRRYQMMWKSIFRYLDDVYQCVHGKRCVEKATLDGDQNFAEFMSIMQRDNEAVLWKMSYLRSKPDLLIFLGLLRIECIVEKAFSSVTPEPLAQCKLQAHGDQRSFVEHVKSLLLRGLPQDVEGTMESRAKAFASHMICALGVDPRCLEKRSKGAGSTLADVAQIIILGVPLGLYSRYFVKSVPEFVRIGVNAMPQPNSVVFSKFGINKSTTVQYLLGESCDPNESLLQTTGVGHSLLRRRARELPLFCSTKMIALGDNPHTTDYGLTVSPKVKFISVEKVSQREKRHQRIKRRLNRTRMLEESGKQPCMPDGSPAPSYKQLMASLTRYGPLMDDRLFKNILYVGNEEEGTAGFLTALMDELKVPSFSVSAKSSCKQGTMPVDSETFTEALFRAVRIASCDAQPNRVKSNL